MLTSGDGGSGTLGFREVWWTFSIAWISGTFGTASNYPSKFILYFEKTKFKAQ